MTRKVLPICFNAHQADLIRSGTKIQFRRLTGSRLDELKTGDVLYLREPFRIDRRHDFHAPLSVDRRYADVPVHVGLGQPPPSFGKLRYARAMPRAWSSATLIVLHSHVENLAQISAASCVHEGILPAPNGTFTDFLNPHSFHTTARSSFGSLWDSQLPLQGKKVSERWASRPLVRVITFRSVPMNVDVWLRSNNDALPSAA